MKLLDKIRVLDITKYVAGPIAAAYLSDLGAEVIHIEAVGGGEDRKPLPLKADIGCGVGFLQCNRNKKGFTLDLSCDKGQEILHKLVKTADIVIANLPIQSIRSLGIDYEQLCKIKPDIIMAHISSFGATGPYAERVGFDGLAQVMCGLTYLSGEPEQPMKSAAAWVDMTTGTNTALGIMAALFHRANTGKGQKVEANLLQSAMSVANYFLIEQDIDQLNRKGTANRAPSGGPADLIKTKDGGFFIAVLGSFIYKRWTKLVGREDLFDEPRYKDDESRATYGEELSAITSEWAADKTTEEAMQALAKAKIPAGPLLSPQQILDDVHVNKAGFLHEIKIDGLDKPVKYVKTPFSLSETPPKIHSGPPKPGEHTGPILKELGYTDSDIKALKKEKVV